MNICNDMNEKIESWGNLYKWEESIFKDDYKERNIFKNDGLEAEINVGQGIETLRPHPSPWVL